MKSDYVQRVQRRSLAVLSVAQIVSGVGVAIGVALSSVVVDELSGWTMISGFAGSSTVLGAALLALPMAKLSSIRGRRAGLSLAYLAALTGCAISVCAITWRNWPLLLAGLLLLGGGSAGNLAARYTATDLSPKHRSARHLALVVWASTVGSVAGPNLTDAADRVGMEAGLVEKAGPFALAGVAFAMAMVILLWGLRPDPLKVAREQGGMPVRATARDHMIRTAWLTLRMTPMARLALVIVAVSHTTMVAVMGMASVKLYHDGASLDVVGLVVSLHVATMYVLSPLVGWLADMVGRLPVMVLAMAFLLGGTLLAGGHHPLRLAVALMLIGLGWSCGLVGGSALLTELVSVERRPAVQGFADLIMNVCGAMATIAGGAVVGFLSFSMLMLLLGILVASTGIWLLRNWLKY